MKERSCKTCGFCEYLYFQFAYGYSKTKTLYCSEREVLTESADLCEKWRRKEKIKIDLSPQRFDEAEEDIKILLRLLKDM